MAMAADRRVKPVVRFGGGMEERMFPSVYEAGRWCVGHCGAASPEATSGDISKVIRGLGATSYGFRWRRVGRAPRGPFSDPSRAVVRSGGERAHPFGLRLPLAYAGRIEEFG